MFGIYSLALLAVCVTSAALAVFSWSRRRTPGAQWMSWMMLALAVWSGAYAMELASRDQAAMLFWTRVEYLGIVTVPVFWLLLTLHYGRPGEPSGPRLPMGGAFLFLIPVCTLLLNYTNEWHHLYYSSMSVERHGTLSLLALSGGPWYWVNLIYGYLLILAGSVLLLRHVLYSPGLYRRQAWALVVAALTPLCGNILYQVGLTPFDYLDLTPFAFVITGAALAWALYRLHLFDVTPVARDRLIETLRDGMLVLDAQGRITDLNPAARAYLGLAQTVVGQPVQTVRSAWPGLAEFCARGAAQTDDTMTVSSPHAVTPAATTEITLAGAAPRHLEAQLSPIGAPSGPRRGRFLGSVLLLRDITERKEAEAARRARQAADAAYHAIRQIVDTVEEGLVLLDNAQQVVMANRVGLAHLELLAGVGVGQRLTRVGGHALEELLRPPAGLPHTPLTLEEPARYDFEAALHPLQQPEILDGWLLVTRDVTQLQLVREQNEQQERLAAVGQLAAGIAHDFNNILAVIVLYTGLLQRASNLLPAQQRQLDTVSQQARHASHLVQQILDFSRKTMIVRSVLDLAVFLEQLAELCRHTLPETITVTLEMATLAAAQEKEGDGLRPVADGVPPVAERFLVRADPSRLQQSLLNLVFNARDAMPDGGELRLRLAHLTIEPGEGGALWAPSGSWGPPPAPVDTFARSFQDKLSTSLAAGEWIVLQVSDSGAGIEPAVLPHIFEPFFTTKGQGPGLSRATEREGSPGKGAGLGLAQVFGIVKQHDGEITVESQVGLGTTVTIYLPRAADDGEGSKRHESCVTSQKCDG